MHCSPHDASHRIAAEFNHWILQAAVVEKEKMSTDSEDKTLLDREAEFWDRQEEAIESLYARPHDWRFMPNIAKGIIAPRINFVVDVLTKRRGSIDSLLDIGCGNGWFCHVAAEAGVRTFGVDLSPRKIETARAEAERRGLSDLCTFEAADIMELEIPGKVDLLTAHGSLHHFPDLERLLPLMVERFLNPDGYMLFSEPHYEGMSPGLQRFVLGLAQRWPFKHLFDLDFYYEVTGATEKAEQGDDEYNIRGESPAGLEFFGEEPDMGKILRERYHVLEERFFHNFSGHLTNAFYVYMKSRVMRGLYRMLLPLIIRADTAACRREKHGRYAEEGVWLLENKPAR